MNRKLNHCPSGSSLYSQLAFDIVAAKFWRDYNMASILIKNIGTLVTGKLESPLRQADSIYIRDDVVHAIGNGLNQAADQTIDARILSGGSPTTCTAA
jgi:hypothetical protein